MWTLSSPPCGPYKNYNDATDPSPVGEVIDLRTVQNSVKKLNSVFHEAEKNFSKLLLNKKLVTEVTENLKKYMRSISREETDLNAKKDTYLTMDEFDFLTFDANDEFTELINELLVEPYTDGSQLPSGMMDVPSVDIQLNDPLLSSDQPSPDCHEQMQLFDFSFENLSQLDTEKTELQDDQTSPKARHASHDSTSSISSPIVEEICTSLELPIPSDSDPVLELDDVDLEEMSALLSDSDLDELLSPDSRCASSSSESTAQASTEELDSVMNMFSDAMDSSSNVFHATPTLFGSGAELNNELSLQNILSWCPPTPLQTFDFNHV